jgi:hypothetical protein
VHKFCEIVSPVSNRSKPHTRQRTTFPRLYFCQPLRLYFCQPPSIITMSTDTTGALANPADSSTNAGGRKNNRSGKKGSFIANRRSSDDNGIEELRGKVFMFGVQGQKERFIKAKKAVAEYLGRTSDAPKELYMAIQSGVEPTFTEPEDPGPNATPAQLKKYDTLFKKNDAKQELYMKEKAKAFRIIMSQCSTAMRNKLETLPEFQDWESKDNFVALLERMRQLVYGTDKGQYEFWEMQAAKSGLFNLKQEGGEPLANYLLQFDDQVRSTESAFGPLIPTFTIKGKPTEEELKNRNKFLACVFLANADRERFKPVIDDLGNDFGLGSNNYPAYVPSMLNLLSNRHGLKTPKSKQIEDLQDGVKGATSFHQTKYPKNNQQKAHSKAKEYGRKKTDSNSDKSGPSGWFSEKKKPKQVTSFRAPGSRAMRIMVR